MLLVVLTEGRSHRAYADGNLAVPEERPELVEFILAGRVIERPGPLACPSRTDPPRRPTATQPARWWSGAMPFRRAGLACWDADFP